MAKSRMDLSTEGVPVLAQALMESEVSVEESAAGRGWAPLSSRITGSRSRGRVTGRG
jgi:hypothetical protein